VTAVRAVAAAVAATVRKNPTAVVVLATVVVRSVLMAAAAVIEAAQVASTHLLSLPLLYSPSHFVRQVQVRRGQVA